MIVEFVGSTGAGKTTIASEVQRRLARSAPVVSAYDLAADLLGLGRATNPTLRNLTQDLVALPFFFRALVRHRAFVAFALRIVARQSGLSFLTLNYVRSIIRKVGIYEMSKRYGRDRIVLVDEGTVSSVHLLFVFTRQLYSEDEIKEFAALVPLPGLVVYIKAPVDVLVQRALQRSDAPREMRAKDQREIEEYVWRAARMFDQLSGGNGIRERVLVVSNPPSTGGELGVVADGIAAGILNIESVPGKRRARPAGEIRPVSVIGGKGVN